MNMRVHDSSVYIAREAEIVGINNQPLQTDISIAILATLETEARALASGMFAFPTAATLENMQLDAEKLLWIRTKVFQQSMQFGSGAVYRIVKGGVHQ